MLHNEEENQVLLLPIASLLTLFKNVLHIF